MISSVFTDDAAFWIFSSTFFHSVKMKVSASNSPLLRISSNWSWLVQSLQSDVMQVMFAESRENLSMMSCGFDGRADSFGSRWLTAFMKYTAFSQLSSCYRRAFYVVSRSHKAGEQFSTKCIQEGAAFSIGSNRAAIYNIEKLIQGPKKVLILLENLFTVHFSNVCLVFFSWCRVSSIGSIKEFFQPVKFLARRAQCSFSLVLVVRSKEKSCS